MYCGDESFYTPGEVDNLSASERERKNSDKDIYISVRFASVYFRTLFFPPPLSADFSITVLLISAAFFYPQEFVRRRALAIFLVVILFLFLSKQRSYRKARGNARLLVQQSKLSTESSPRGPSSMFG